MIETSAANANPAQVYTDLNSLQQIKTLEKSDKSAAIGKVARQFESMMMQMMLKSMREANSVFSDGDITSSSEGKMYQDMFDSQLTLNLSQGKGMGIAAAIVRQMQGRLDNQAHATPAGVDDRIEAVTRNTAPVPGVYLGESAAATNVIQEAIYHLFGDAQVGDAPIDASDSLALDGTPQSFVEKLRPIAERIAKRLGVDSRALLSQSALETGWGQKILQCADGRSSFNFFNIKADDNWTGAVVTVPTIEYQDGIAVREFAKFRAYGSPEESFSDYAKLISESPRYQSAMHCANDPHAYIKALAQSGYATDPQYAQKVLAVLDGEHITGGTR